MKNICFACEKEVDMKSVKTTRTTTVRGIEVNHDDFYYECPLCHERSWSDELPDPAHLAFAGYRTIKGFLPPEEIRGFRKRLDLTQRELGLLIGISYVTLSRYESGALQDEKHNDLLKRAMEDPQWLFSRLKEVALQLPESKVSLLEEICKLRIRSAFASVTPWTAWEMDPPSIFNGYKKFQLDKYIQAVLVFCEKGVPKTKLNKLLFYFDFYMYKAHGTSAIGLTFVRDQFGPVVRDHYSGVAALLRDKYLKIVDEIVGEHEFEKLVSIGTPDLSVFSKNEFAAIEHVLNKLGKTTAKRISEISHQESAWIEVTSDELISYSYAKSVQAV